MIRAFALTGCLIAVALATASAAPASYVAEYDVFRNGSALGALVVRVEPADDGLWRMASQTRGTRGMASLANVEVDETSTFRWDASGIEAVRYDYHQSAVGRSRARSLEVDAAAGRVVSTDRGDSTTLPHTAGVLDRHILPLAIAGDLSAGRSGELRYQVADRGEVSEHVYRVVGPERLDLDGRGLDTVRVERHRDDSDRVTVLWLDPAQGHLPVKVRQNEGRHVMESRLRRVQR